MADLSLLALHVVVPLKPTAGMLNAAGRIADVSPEVAYTIFVAMIEAAAMEIAQLREVTETDPVP